MSDLIPPEKLELLLNAIRPGMPHGVTLEGTCRGDWLDLHLAYDGARLSRVKAFWLGQFQIAKAAYDPHRETLGALDRLDQQAKRVAKKLIDQRGIEWRFEQVRLGRPCIHFGAGGYICDFCGLWVPRLS